MVRTARTTMLNFRVPHDLFDRLRLKAQSEGVTLTDAAVAIFQNALIQPERADEADSGFSFVETVRSEN